MEEPCLLNPSELPFPLYESVLFPFPCGDLYVAHQKMLVVKNLPAVQEMWVLSLGWEDPWRREWQPTPVFTPGESPLTEEPVGLQSIGLQRVRHN